MKKILFVIVALLYAATAQCQTIHWLTFIDTNDEHVGEMDKNGQALLFSRFRNVVNAALSTAGYKADNQEFFGNRLTPQNCKDAITSLKCDENDIIVFYYIGHGTHAAAENNPFPQMMMGVSWDKERYFIPLQWAHDQLKSKGARLCVTIGMCCNPIQGASAKSVLRFSSNDFSHNYGNTYITDYQIENILHLFLESKGDIIQATAKVGELSWGFYHEDMNGWIDSWTRNLILEFDDMMKTGKDTDWNDFLGNTGKRTAAEHDKIRIESRSNPKGVDAECDKLGCLHTQTPFNQINVTKAPRPKFIPTPEPDKTAESAEEALEYYLSYLVKRDTKVSDRIAAKKKFLTWFASDAEVKILGQDGNTVIDKESPSKFAGRISTSRILLNVALDDCALDAHGKITTLWVKEYYKKN